MKSTILIYIFLLCLLAPFYVRGQDGGGDTPTDPTDPTDPTGSTDTCPTLLAKLIVNNPPCTYSLGKLSVVETGITFIVTQDPPSVDPQTSVYLLPGSYVVVVTQDTVVETCNITIENPLTVDTNIPNVSSTIKSCLDSNVDIKSGVAEVVYTSVTFNGTAVTDPSADGVYTVAGVVVGQYAVQVDSDACLRQVFNYTVTNTATESMTLTFQPSACPAQSTIKVTLSSGFDAAPVFSLNGVAQTADTFSIAANTPSNVVVYDNTVLGCKATGKIVVNSSQVLYAVSHSFVRADKCAGAIVTLKYNPTVFTDIKVYDDKDQEVTVDPVAFTFTAAYGTNYTIKSVSCSLQAEQIVHSVLVNAPVVQLSATSGLCDTQVTVTVPNYLDFTTLSVQYTLANSTVATVLLVNGMATIPISSTASLNYQSSDCSTPTVLPLGITTTPVVLTPIVEIISPFTLCAAGNASITITHEGVNQTKNVAFQPNTTYPVTFTDAVDPIDCPLTLVWTSPVDLGYDVEVTPATACDTDASATVTLTGYAATQYDELYLDEAATVDGGWTSVAPAAHVITYKCKGVADPSTINLVVANTKPAVPFTIAAPVAPTTCSSTDGSIVVTKNENETNPITVTSSAGQVDDATTTISGLSASNTQVNVTVQYGDQGKCSSLTVVNMPALAPIQPTVTVSSATGCTINENSAVITTPELYDQLVLKDDQGNVIAVDATQAGTYNQLFADQQYTLTGTLKSSGCPFTSTLATPSVQPLTTTIVEPVSTQETCQGSFDGTITITQPTQPLVFVMGGSQSIDGIYTGLTTGTYQITRANQIANPFCQVTPSIVTSSVTTLYTPAIAVTPIDTCMNTNNSFGGLDTVVSSIGQGWNVTYVLDGSNTSVASGHFVSLASGEHTITATVNQPSCRRVLSSSATIVSNNIVVATYNNTICNNLLINVIVSDKFIENVANNYTITIQSKSTSNVTYTNNSTVSNLFNVTEVAADNYTITISSTTQCNIIFDSVQVTKCVPIVDSSDSNNGNPPTNNSSHEKSKGINGGKLAGIIIGVSVAVAAIGAVAYVVIKRSMDKKYHHPIEMDNPKYKIMMDQN